MMKSSNLQGVNCAMDFDDENNFHLIDSSIVDLNHDIGEDGEYCDDKKGICRSGPWSLEEDKWLKNYVQKKEEQQEKVNWGKIASELNRIPESCILRWCNQLRPKISRKPFTIEEDGKNCDDKEGIRRKGPWSPEEDRWLENFVEKNGIKKGNKQVKANWGKIARELHRTPRSCRLRWCNQLAPEISFEPFTVEEDEFIIHMVHTRGGKWSLIAGMLKGRTDNQVKNRWNSALKKVHRQRQPEQDSGRRVTQTPKQSGNLNGSRPSLPRPISDALPTSISTSAVLVTLVPPASINVGRPCPAAGSINSCLPPAFVAPHPLASQNCTPASMYAAPSLAPFNWLNSLNLCSPGHETPDVTYSHLFPGPSTFYPSQAQQRVNFTAMMQEIIGNEGEEPNFASRLAGSNQPKY